MATQQRDKQESAAIFKAFENLCFRQRVTATAMSVDDFRRTLVQLFSDASDSELINLAIDVEDSKHDDWMDV